MLGILGWVIVGAVLTGALKYFWNDIKNWLDNTAANAVERVLGYDARKAMQKAVCRVDRVVNHLRTRAEVYYKRNRLDAYCDKVTLEATAPVYEFKEDVLDEIRNKEKLEQTFKFMG